MLLKDGTYDSDGFFGFGTWLYQNSRLYLVPNYRFAGTLVSSFMQDHRVFKTGAQGPLLLDKVGKTLRFYTENHFPHVGRMYIIYERTSKHLKRSSRAIYTRRRKAHP